MSSEDTQSKSNGHRHSFLNRTLFLDVLTDRRIRPVILYTVLIVGISAGIYHWLEGWSWVESVQSKRGGTRL